MTRMVPPHSNIILDRHVLDISEPRQLETEINNITGVVSNGLFSLQPADILLVGHHDGVEEREPDTSGRRQCSEWYYAALGINSRLRLNTRPSLTLDSDSTDFSAPCSKQKSK